MDKLESEEQSQCYSSNTFIEVVLNSCLHILLLLNSYIVYCKVTPEIKT
jgi:hypothetical protein